MAAKSDEESQESPQFSITLPLDALDMIENGLRHFGLYGKPRATICRALILDMLKTQTVQDQIQKGRDKAKRP